MLGSLLDRQSHLLRTGGLGRGFKFCGLLCWGGAVIVDSGRLRLCPDPKPARRGGKNNLHQNSKPQTLKKGHRAAEYSR